MVKKKKILAAVVLTILLCRLLFASIPRPLFREAEDIQIHTVEQYADGSNYVQITDQADLAALAQGLAGLKCSRVLSNFSPHPVDDVIYRIAGAYNGEVFFIIAGNLNYLYESADKGGYNIRDGEKLVSLIESCITQE